VVAIDCETGAALAAFVAASSPVTAVISAASPMPATTAHANATRRGLRPRRRWGMAGDGTGGHLGHWGMTGKRKEPLADASGSELIAE
jgi:hypothetical protein